jgi:hypothetical protein
MKSSHYLIYLITAISASTAKGVRWDQTPNIQRVDLGQPLHANETCVLWQECKGRGIWPFGRPMDSTTCRVDGGAVQAGDVLNPVIKYYAPSPIVKPDQKKQITKNCPMFDPNTPLCCNDDQAEIIDANFV